MDPETDSTEIDTEYDNRAYVPGEALRGTVRWQNGERAVLRLRYDTAGKGTCDGSVQEERTFEGGGNGAFEFKLPEGPYSFSGKLVSLRWALELAVEGGPVKRCEFILSPTGREIDLHAHAHAEMPPYSDMSVGSWKRKGRSRA